jgi:hypothetical protein
LTRAAPWDREKQQRRVLSPDDVWAGAICDKIDASNHPLQLAAVNDPAKRITLLTGRGATKTTTFRMRLVKKAVKRIQVPLLYFAITRDQAALLMWDPLKEMLDRLEVAADFNETKLRCTIRRTGSQIFLAGADDKREIEKWRGKSFGEVDMDEVGSWPDTIVQHLVFRIIAPRLGDLDGTIGLGGTPGLRKRGLFFEWTGDGMPAHCPYAQRTDPELSKRGVSSHAWSLADIAALPNATKLYPAIVALWLEALQEKARNQWSDDNPIWRREYLGKWAEDDTENVFRYRAWVGGNQWNQWEPERTGSLRFGKLPDDLVDIHYAIALDQGYKDPFACNVFAFSPRDKLRRIFHVFAFEKTGMYARPIAELLLGKEEVESVVAGRPGGKLGGILGETGWPDAIIADADEALLAELSNVYGIRIAKAEKNANYKAGAIELVNGDLVDGRFKVLKDSPLEKQMSDLQWKVDEDTGVMREDKAQPNHSTDCAIYGRRAISHLFSGDPPPPGRAGPTSGGYVDPQGLGEDEPEPPKSFDDLYEASDNWRDE